MNAIVVVDKNWAIGKDGDLLCHLKKDLQYFKEKTTGKVIVIGRKTLESFPGAKPLPNRTNIVLTGNKDYKNDACVVCCGMDALDSELLKYDTEDIFVAGGETIYQQFLDKCNKLYVTRIDAEFEADKHFPNIDENDDFKLVSESGIVEENGFQYTFCVYERV
ncbi:MAG: dihydrofolate reductase [Eubacteriales bacterium]|nr:dihydrofolate reductase [Eubacteriales bacterium]MDY3332840.1 dihydrofolate reductase [Gallibacter sp.]